MAIGILVSKLVNVKYLLFQTLKGWLESIVESLQGGSAESPQKRLASAVLIAYCIRKASISTAHLKIDDFTTPLLRMLCLRPDLEKQQCQDFAYLCEVLPKEYRYVKMCYAMRLIVMTL